MTEAAPATTAVSFKDRLLLARYPSGGVVVNLQSGNYFRVNATAAAACEAIRETGDEQAATDRLALEMSLSVVEAAGLVASVLEALSAKPVKGELQGSYHFFPEEAGYGLWHGQRQVLKVSGVDLSIRLPSSTPLPDAASLELYVRALAPKLLFASGAIVIHASACLLRNQIVGFAGLSGAGKTTTARAFAAAGAELLSEDLLILTLGPDRAPRALLKGEAFVQDWARQVASALLSDPNLSVDSARLADVLQGPTGPLARIWFLDRDRRTGVDFTTRRLEQPDALIALMTHYFLGAVEPVAWKRFFETAATLVGGPIATEEAFAPNGLEHLQAAAANLLRQQP